MALNSNIKQSSCVLEKFHSVSSEKKRREKEFKQLAQDGTVRWQNFGGDSVILLWLGVEGEKLASEHSLGQRL